MYSHSAKNQVNLKSELCNNQEQNLLQQICELNERVKRLEAENSRLKHENAHVKGLYYDVYKELHRDKQKKLGHPSSNKCKASCGHRCRREVRADRRHRLA